MCGNAGGLRHRNYRGIRAFFFFFSSNFWQLAFKGPPWLVLFCAWCSRHSKAPLNGIFIARCIRHLKGHPLWGLSLLVSFWCQSVVKEATVMSPPPACDSAVPPCLHGCLAFLQRCFLSWSPPSHSLRPSPLRQQEISPWNYSPILMQQLSAALHSRKLASLSKVLKALSRIVCVVLTPFRLS